MNLRVDLILDDERRITGVMNPKSLGRIASIVLPVILAVVLVHQLIEVMRLKTDLNALETEWATAEPREKRAQTLAQESRANTAILEEIEGWRKSQMAWHTHLLTLMHAIPDNVQLRDLRISHNLQVIEDTTPARVFQLDFKGKAFGADAENSVESLNLRLAQTAPFSNELRKVEVPLFGADPSPDSDRNDRVFEILCSYAERKF